MPADASQTARNSLAVYLLVLCVFSGATALIATAAGSPTEPPAVVAAVPAWARMGWYVLLVFGAGVALAGVWHPHRNLGDAVTGLLLERTGLLGLMLGAALYGVALASLDGPVSKVSGMITLGFAVACGFRIPRIGQDLERIRALLRGQS